MPRAINHENDRILPGRDGILIHHGLNRTAEVDLLKDDTLNVIVRDNTLLPFGSMTSPKLMLFANPCQPLTPRKISSGSPSRRASYRFYTFRRFSSLPDHMLASFCRTVSL